MMHLKRSFSSGVSQSFYAVEVDSYLRNCLMSTPNRSATIGLDDRYFLLIPIVRTDTTKIFLREILFWDTGLDEESISVCLTVKVWSFLER